mgnify:FL=1
MAQSTDWVLWWSRKYHQGFLNWLWEDLGGCDLFSLSFRVEGWHYSFWWLGDSKSFTVIYGDTLAISHISNLGFFYRLPTEIFQWSEKTHIFLLYSLKIFRFLFIYRMIISWSIGTVGRYCLYMLRQDHSNVKIIAAVGCDKLWSQRRRLSWKNL